ncbi:MAG TPA: Pr6Pr family membrane protein [Patescibacteria group bacterium]|nr:Pr6Pr family membrane protein [Patescibacteria group bacterium]
MRWYFVFFGLVNFIALFVAFILSLNVIADYFSYFTVLSNILVTGIFLTIGLFGFKKMKKSRFISIFYGASVLYMGITGIVYWTILHGGKQLTTDVEWITLVLHGLMPIAVVVGWILISKHYTWKHILSWLLFPFFFVIYTLIRGFFVHWYPYPFLNPSLVGYEGVVIWTFGILTGSFFVGLFLLLLGKVSWKHL